MSQQQNPDAVEQSLYAKKAKIYPREVHGLFATMRFVAMVGLLGVFYGASWIQWNGRQAFLWDLPNRKFYILDWVFWPQDFFYLAALLILSALLLFIVTAFAGRLWCGYACPQTVWTEIFMWIERKIEGDRRDQIKLDKRPWNRAKLTRKGLKHLAWAAFAFYTGFSFVGYFVPIRELAVELATFNISGWSAFWVFFYGFATWGNAGFMREQVCIYMCPYARFQSAMFDDDTLIISYDEERGEPRGTRRKGVPKEEHGKGDCIDCTICVQVCPTGIDIRQGLQYECIACAACVDACDDVMSKMGYEPGLVKYTTLNESRGGKRQLLRPRLFVYLAIMGIILGGLGWSLANRVPAHLDVIRDRNALYRETVDGLVENVYVLRLVNMDDAAHSYKLSVQGLDDMRLDMDRKDVHAGKGAVIEMAARVAVDPEDLESLSSNITFVLEAWDDPKIRVEKEARFLGPLGGR